MNKLGQPFVDAARIRTMRNDIDALRQSVRAGDMIAANEALDRCERWFNQLRPITGHEAPDAVLRKNEGAL